MPPSSRQRVLPGLDFDAPTPAPSHPARQTKTAPTSPTVDPPADLPLDTPSLLPDLAGKRVFVVDANSLIFQVFHAIPEMTSPRGQPVNAVFGYTRDMLYLLEQQAPDYLFCAFDLAGPTFRHELFEGYKGTRSEMPEDLAPQFDFVRQTLSALTIPILELEGFEADDILATLARICDEQSAQCFLVSGDKDCRQLLSPQVQIFNIRKNQFFDAAALQADWGIRPDQVIDYQALVGDSVDNVPGVPGIGPKTARELLQTYGTLDELLARAGEVAGTKRRENLQQFADQARLCRKLVALDQEVPLDIDWSAGQVRGFDPEPVLALFTEFGFHSLGQKVKSLMAQRPQVDWQADYQLISSGEQLAELVAEASQQAQISFDTETTSIHPTQAEIVGYALAWKPGHGYYIPVRAPAGEPCLDPQATLAVLRPLLENPAIGKVGQNLKYDMIVLRNLGVALAGVQFDTMIASYLLDAGERVHNLDELASRYLQHNTIKITQLIGTGRDQKRMDEVPVDQVCQYAAEDAEVPLRLIPLLADKLRQQELTDLFQDLELPLIDVLVELESNGIKVDLTRLAQLSEEYGQQMQRLEREIYELAGTEFNIASPKQLQEILFQRHQLPIVKRTKTGPSTDADVLEQLAKLHPLPAKIIDYRQVSKLKGTYVDAIPALVHPSTGRVHACFNQVVAATGRLSSSDPNLQNIPIRTQQGREIRSAFLPGHDDWLLLAADYSQIELRILAHFSQDETLCGAFDRDEDIHALVASQVYGVPLDQVNSEQRRSAKAVNFGVIYGQSPFGLARALDIEQSAAAQFINAYFDRYPGVEQFLLQVLKQCLHDGYVKTILGRRRAITGVRSGTGRQRNLPERTAINTVIQGSAADLIKQAMIAVHRRLRDERFSARMLLQIHDELVFEVPPHELEAVGHLVRQGMSGVAQLRVPLKVDVKSGCNWAEVEPWA
jgi:DNA polymerase-1